MKKLFLVTMFISTSVAVFAQSVHFGLKAGVNVANLKANNGGTYNSHTSFNAGGLAHIHISEHFAVQPEIYYSGQGAEKNDLKVSLGYINIPVLAQYMFGNGFRLETGPQLGLLTSAKYKTGETETNEKDAYDGIDFSWAFGASYQFPKTGVGIDARYNLGLINVYQNGPPTLKNRLFSIGMFYQFTK